MTTDEAALVRDRIREWPDDDRRWFRRLLGEHPAEAVRVSELVLLLDARPETLLYS